MVRLVVLMAIHLVLLLGNIGAAYALDMPVSPDVWDLNQRLKQLVNAAAPANMGMDYFILPDEWDFEKIPSEEQNPLTPEKVRLGQLLFHETALSINPINPKHWQQSSCASCHFAEAGFRSNLAQGLGTGGLGWNQRRHRDEAVFPTEIDKQNILVPSVLNSAYQDVMMWDGRLGSTGPNRQEDLVQEFDVNRFGMDGLETQAIDGMIVHKLGTAAISRLREYQKLFAEAFPDRPYVAAEVEDIKRAGLAIAAYERTLLTNQAPFQKWLKGDTKAMSDQQLRGGITFFSSSCAHCHTGPNLAATNFYAVGFADHQEDWNGVNFGRGSVTKTTSDDFKFKIPQLYNLADSSPYGHGASFNSLREIVEYFNRAEPQNLAAKYSGNISVWFRPLNLTAQQIDDLTAFLEIGLRDPNLNRYVPERLPTGLCFPNNDDESRQQLGCDGSDARNPVS